MPAKIVVKAYRGGSRVSLLGSSGKELLTSSVFTEPRAKGATLRALRGLLGDIAVEDQTLSSAKAGAAKTLPRSASAGQATVVAASARVRPKPSTKPATVRRTRVSKATASR